MTFLQRYRLARRKRTCPKCKGAGTDIMDTILRHNFRKRPCSLCGGDGWVRYTRRVAWGVARRGRIDHEDDPALAAVEP